MKTKAAILAIGIFLCSDVFAQDSAKKKIREYYVSFVPSIPLNMQLKYKKQIKERTFFKIGFIDLSAYTSQTQNGSGNFPVNTNGFSGGLQVGIEYRKPVSDKLTIFHGPNVGVSYFYRETVQLNPALPVNQRKNMSTSIGASIPYSFGLLYKITSNILIAAELNPSVSFLTNGDRWQASPGSWNRYGHLSFGLDNRIGLLSIVYRL